MLLTQCLLVPGSVCMSGSLLHLAHLTSDDWRQQKCPGRVAKIPKHKLRKLLGAVDITKITEKVIHRWTWELIEDVERRSVRDRRALASLSRDVGEHGRRNLEVLHLLAED